MCKAEGSIFLYEGFRAGGGGGGRGLVGDVTRGRFGAGLRTKCKKLLRTWGLRRAGPGHIGPQAGAMMGGWWQPAVPTAILILLVTRQE